MNQKIFTVGKIRFSFTMLVKVKTPKGNGKEQFLPCLSWNRNKEPLKTLGVYNAVTIQGYDPMVEFVVKVPDGEIWPYWSGNGTKKYSTKQWLIVETFDRKSRTKKVFIAGYKKEEDETVKFNVKEKDESTHSLLTQKLVLPEFKKEMQSAKQKIKEKIQIKEEIPAKPEKKKDERKFSQERPEKDTNSRYRKDRKNTEEKINLNDFKGMSLEDARA
jgi:hypothetical protein